MKHTIYLQLESVENFVISGWPDWIKINLDIKSETVNKLELVPIHDDEWDEDDPESEWNEISVSVDSETGNISIDAEYSDYIDVGSGGENHCHICFNPQ